MSAIASHALAARPTVHHHLALLRAAGPVRVYVPFPGPSRYGLSPHTLGALAVQLGTYPNLINSKAATQMLVPNSLEVLVATRHADLLREAAIARLASQASQANRRSPAVRRRLAEVLYALAAKVDPCACGVPANTPASRTA
jgi:hypothetical protein